MKTAVARVVAESAAKMNALVVTEKLARLDDDLRSVRLDVVVTRNQAQPPIELAWPIHESLDARANVLGDSQRLVRAGPQHREQRPDDERQQDKEGRDRRERRSASESAQEPSIHRVAEGREDRREQDGQEEGADHRHECDRDRRDEQEQKRLAEAGLTHARERQDSTIATARTGSRGRSTVKTHPLSGRLRA